MILLHAVRLTAAAAAVRPEDAASEQCTALQLQEQACNAPAASLAHQQAGVFV